MKKKSFIFMFVLIFLVTTVQVSATNIQKYKDVDLRTMISSDGGPAEMMANDFANEFLDNPTKAVAKIMAANLNDVEYEKVLNMLSAELYWGQGITVDSFPPIKKPSSELVKKIREDMLKYIDIYENEVNTETIANSEMINYDFPKYNPRKLKELFEMNIYSDEDIRLLNLALTADYNFFIEEFNKLEVPKQLKVASKIDKTILKNMKIDNYVTDSSIQSSEDISVLEKYSTSIINETVNLASSRYSGTKWEIDVCMYLSNDRSHLGRQLTLYDPDGYYRWHTTVMLARSVSNASPSVWQGNTPDGVFTAQVAGPHSNTYSYGINEYIYTVPVSGDVVTYGRSGIWIHGGDASTNTSSAYYPLRPTYGCVRITNEAADDLAFEINEMIEMGAATIGKVVMFSRSW